MFNVPKTKVAINAKTEVAPKGADKLKAVLDDEAPDTKPSTSSPFGEYTTDYRSLLSLGKKLFRLRKPPTYKFLETWEVLSMETLPKNYTKALICDNAIDKDALFHYCRKIGVNIQFNPEYNLICASGKSLKQLESLHEFGNAIFTFEFDVTHVFNLIILTCLFKGVILYKCKCTSNWYMLCNKYNNADVPLDGQPSEVPTSIINIIKEASLAAVTNDNILPSNEWVDMHAFKNSTNLSNKFNANVRKHPDANVELEHKFKSITLNDMKDLLAKLKETKGFKTMISRYVVIMVSKDNKTYRLVADLDKKKKFGEIKESVYSVSRKDGITSSISLETTIPYEKVSSIITTLPQKYCRVIYRMSVKYGNWQFDFSHVRSTTQLSLLKKIRDDMFETALTSDNFLDIDPSKITNHELEAEFVGDVLEEEDIETPILMVKSNGDYQNALYTIAKLVGHHYAENFRSTFGLKRLVKNVQPLTRSVYVHVDDKWFVSEKKDGVHCILHASNGTLNILTSKLESVKIPSNVFVIVEGELMGDTIYIFNIRSKYANFADDVKNFDKIAKQLQNKLYKIKTKPFLPYSTANVKKLLGGGGKSSNDIEGAIFISPKGDQYKWKFPDKVSIDFYVKKFPDSMNLDIMLKRYNIKQDKKKTCYILLNGITKPLYNQLGLHSPPEFPSQGSMFPVIFEPLPIYQHASDDLDGTVCEFSLPSNSKSLKSKSKSQIPNSLSLTWTFMRIRTDREVELKRGNYFGNYYSVAHQNWFSMIHPFTLEELMSPESINPYFFSESSEAYLPQRRFNSRVKWDLYNDYSSHVLVDLAAGKGQDINKAYSNFEFAVFVDKDVSALEELQRRNLQSFRSKKGGKGQISSQISKELYAVLHPLAESDEDYANFCKPIVAGALKRDESHKLISHIVVADLSTNYKEVLEKINHVVKPDKKFTADVVMLHFAIHYLIGDQNSIANLIRLVYSLLKPKGKFIFTCMDGKKVHELTEKPYDNGKYAIRRQYKGKLSDTGQIIEVKLPFIKDEYSVENLVNIEYLIKMFRKAKFKCLAHESFASKLGKYGTALSPDDKEFVSLYSYVVLQR